MPEPDAGATGARRLRRMEEPGDAMIGMPGPESLTRNRMC